MRDYFVRRYDDRVVLSTPYDAEYVEAIKDDVRPRFRSYDPDTRTWTVKGPYVATAVELSRYYFPDIPVEDMRGGYHQASPPPGPSASPSAAHAVLYVTPNAPTYVVDAAYRAIAKRLHPDVNGMAGDEQMRAVNAAYERIKQQEQRP